MAKKAVSVVLALVMIFACALPAFALTQDDAQSVVEGKVWAKNEDTTFAFEKTEDYMIVTVVNHAVTFVFHVKSIISKPKLAHFSVDQSASDSYTFISVFNAILLTIASYFE